MPFDNMGMRGQLTGPARPRQFLDEARAARTPQGFKTVDEALEASLAEGRALGESGGTAIQGPGGRYFTSNAEVDAATPGFKELQALKRMGPQLGLFTGANGAFGPEARQFMAGLMAEGNKGKLADAATDQATAEQYKLTDRGMQQDALARELGDKDGQTRRDVAEIEAKGRRDSTGMGAKAQFAAETLRQAGAARERGDGVQADLLMKQYKQQVVELNSELRGGQGGPTALVPTDGGAPGGNQPPAKDKEITSKDFDQADAASAMLQRLGLKKPVVKPGQAPVAKREFSADTMVNELVKNPALADNEQVVDALQTGNGQMSPEALRRQMAARLAAGVRPSGISNPLGERAVTREHTAPDGFKVQSSAVPGDFGLFKIPNMYRQIDVLGPDGEAVSSEMEGNFPLGLGRLFSSSGRMLPRVGIRKQDVAGENALLAKAMRKKGK